MKSEFSLDEKITKVEPVTRSQFSTQFTGLADFCTVTWLG